MVNNYDIHISKKLYNYYSYLNIFLTLTYFILILGITIIDVKFVRYLIVIIHIFICVFLMIKFNYFTKGNIYIYEYDKKFIFSGSLILLLNLFIYELGISLNTNNITSFIEKWKSKLISKISPSYTPTLL